MRLLPLPLHDRPLPSPDDLGRLCRQRYAVLVVAGRSGSGLIHAYLDGHRQVAQIPAIWKFHDFLAAHRQVLQAPPDAAAAAFVAFPAHALLFDTQLSAMHTGTLGPDGDLVVRIDQARFARALVSALGGPAGDARRLLCAVVLAYEWCLGRDLRDARAVLHHLHHGDWLWPELLIDRFNLGGADPIADPRGALKPDLLLVSTRTPLEILRSYPALAAAVTESGPARVAYFETLLRLLIQDWLRARAAAGSDIPTLAVRLEDMKADRAATLGALCRSLGVDAADPALAATTYFGQAWTEDSWSERRRAAVAAQPEIGAAASWQDEAFVLGGLAGLSDDLYPPTAAYGDRSRVLELLLKAASEPSVTLYPGFKVEAAGQAAAETAAWDRLGFLEEFRGLVACQRLGPLRVAGRPDAATA